MSGALLARWSELTDGRSDTAVLPLSLYSRGAPYFATSYVIPQTIPRHRLDHAEVVVVTRGRGRLTLYTVEGGPRSLLLHPGRMVFLRPTDEFAYTPTDDEGIATLYVSFPYTEWQIFAGLVGVHPSWLAADEPPMASVDGDDPAVAVPFREAIAGFERGPVMTDLVEFWLRILPILFPATGRPETEVPPEWLSHALAAMRVEENLRAGLPRLLALAHVSASYLAASTRRYLATTPRALVMDLRLRHAALLLLTTTDPVGAIGTRCGFDKLAYFSTCFRRTYLVSPRQYRRRRGGAAAAPSA